MEEPKTSGPSSGGKTLGAWINGITMATSPSHKFGQLIGNLLEEHMEPELQKFCTARGLYLDKQGERSPARSGRKVKWEDKYGNLHDLDFVIEVGGTRHQVGRPVAFIEAAWRRYTKHSRNKAQEIQGAVLPIAEKYEWDAPFLGAVIAGIFTDGSLDQMRSTGFEILYFSYNSIVEAFLSVNIDVRFDETTPDDLFQRTINDIEALNNSQWKTLHDSLQEKNKSNISNFLKTLEKTLDRQLSQVIVIPLHGDELTFATVNDAMEFINNFDEANGEGAFRKYEVIVRYSNGDSIDASFQSKQSVLDFLAYVSQ